MSRIKQTYTINAPVEKVWEAFVDHKVAGKWVGSPVKISEEAGSKFSLWDGDIHGTNTEVIKYKLLKQDWYSGSAWEKPSVVTFTFESDDKKTKVSLDQQNVPENEAADIAEGWKVYYFEPIKELVE